MSLAIKINIEKDLQVKKKSLFRMGSKSTILA